MLVRSALATLLALALVASAATGVAPAALAETTSTTTAPTGLTVDSLEHPADVDRSSGPIFAWQSSVTTQESYQIQVASSESLLEADEADVWDSGEIDSASSSGIAYDGTTSLDAAERYWWRVRTGSDGTLSDWSDASWFGTDNGSSWSNSDPIWAGGGYENWGDFILSADLTPTTLAATIVFRASTGTDTGYLWQIRSDTNILKTHIGTTASQSIDLSTYGITITAGTTYTLTVQASGSTFTTWIDGTLVNTWTDSAATYSNGGIAFRQGSSEAATVDNITLTSLDGTETLYSNDFSDSTQTDFTYTGSTGTSISSGKLVLAKSTRAYYAGTWSNYLFQTDVKIGAVAAGVFFRATDSSNGYMWQLNASSNVLKTHSETSGTYTAISSVSLSTYGITLATDTWYTLKIKAVGGYVYTYIDDTLVNTYTAATAYTRGFVGVRTGSTETAAFRNLSVTNLGVDGGTLVSTTFPSGDTTFGCGTVSSNVLSVAISSACILASATVNWAFLRDEVELDDQDITWATLYATGSSAATAKQYVYKAWVNGEYVGLGPTQSISTETPYDGFDVTDLLTAGEENAIGVIAYTTTTQKFQAELVVRYADGTTDVFGTDSGWSAMSGDSVFPAAGSIGTSYYVAPKENFNAQAYPYGFDEAGFDDSGWDSAVEKSAFTTLSPTTIGKVQQKLEDAVTIVDKGDGDYFIDFGRTWIGGIQLSLSDGTAGDTLDVRYGEVTSATNTVKYALNTGNTYQDIYTLTDGAQTISTWGMRVFRYVEVVGADEEITVDNLKALALVYPFDEDAATFTSSDDDLNAVWQLSRNSIEALDLNFYTDSWTRERTDYEADAYIQLLSNLALNSDTSLGEYSTSYFSNHRTWPTEWPLYVILAMHDLWMATGDTTQLSTYYTVLQSKLPTSWIDSATGLVYKSSGSSGCSSTTDCDIVDWPSTERDSFDFRAYNTVLNALSYQTFVDMAEVATVLGKTSDATTYASYAANLKASFNAYFYDSSTGSYVDGMTSTSDISTHHAVHSSAFALAFGLVEDDNKSAVAASIAARNTSDEFICSVYCAAFLLPGLYNAGAGQAALDLLTASGTSSWLNMIADGAGATAEAWDSSLKSNLTYSHPWAASPAYIVPTGLFGVKPTTAGYQTFTVKPQPGDLEYGSVTVPTVKGSIGVAFDQSGDDGLEFAVNVPGNTAATVSIPQTDDSSTTVYIDQLPYAATLDSTGYLTVSGVTAGCHVVSTVAGSAAAQNTTITGVCGDDYVAEDLTAPEVTASIEPAATDGWYGADTTLSLDATDDFAVDTVEYRLGDGDWIEYTAPVTLPAGSYEVGYRATDTSGNTTTGSTDVAVDVTAPEVTATASTGSDGITVVLEGTDADSGVASLRYSVDDGDWADYTTPLVLSGDSAHTVDWTAADVAGNASSGSTVVGDQSAPTVTAAITPAATSGWYGANATLTISASDDVAVDTVEYRIGDGDWSAYTAPVTLAGGSYTIDYRATDTAGNTTTGSMSVAVDVTAPTVSASAAQSGSGATVTLSARDSQSGVASLRYRVDGGSWASYTAAFPVSGSGDHTVDWLATDVVGNTSSGTTTVTVTATSVTTTTTLKAVTIKAAVKVAKKSKRAKITVTAVKGAKLTVVVKKAGKTVYRKTITSTAKSRYVLLTKKLRKGSYTVTVRTSTTSSYAAAKKTVRFTVRKNPKG
ncbi:MAG: family 78 glycoside hydrolase catalytic domain [Microbacteriaceae bacterium]